jgi:hypothetical protein
MYSNEIDEFFRNKNDKNIYKGVFSADHLPNSFLLPAAFIVNLSPSTVPGSHWVSIFIDEDRNVEYFDSFGIEPQIPSIISFMKRHGKNIFYTNQQLQHLSSKNCGKYAIVFLLFKMSKKPTSHFINLFNKNSSINDIVIEKF